MNLSSKGVCDLSSFTNIYCCLKFLSDEVINLEDFKQDFQLFERLTWVKGDLQFPKYELSARLDSRVTIKSDVSADYDGEPIINEFFKQLIAKKERLLSLKEMYNGDMYFEIVINLHSDDSPVVRLQPEHLGLLAELAIKLDTCVYDYK